MLIMNENIRIYLHLAMIFAQHNCSSHNICCVIFRMRHYFLLDNQTFNTMFITRVHLLRRDVPHGEGHVSVNQHMSRYGKVKTQDKEFFL